MPVKHHTQAPKWLRERSIGKRRQGAQVSIDSMRRLQLESTLDGHSGCVNCLEWNKHGNLLASGSDDHNVIIWDPFRATRKNIIQTGHKGNIFSVKFIPDTGDNLIATCASDGAVKVINVMANENVLNCTNCHIDRVKRLTVHPNEPHLIWSAGEDSFIMQYDMRVPHTCKSDKPLLDLTTESGGGHLASAKCLAINPMRDEMLAVGTNDVHVRLYDRRLIHQKGLDSCIAYFTPGHLMKNRMTERHNRESFGTTYLAFSPDGSELLANIHAEQVYLFRTYEPWERYKSFDATVKSLILEHPTPITTDNKLKPYAPWKELRKLFACAELPTKYRDFYNEIDEKIRSKTKLVKNDLDKINEILLGTKNCVELYQLRASALIQRAWRGDHYQAIRDCCCALALKPLDDKTLEILAVAISKMGDKESAQGLLELVKLIQPSSDSLQEATRVLSTYLRWNCEASSNSWLDAFSVSPTNSHSDFGGSSDDEFDSNIQSRMQNLSQIIDKKDDLLDDLIKVCRGAEVYDYGKRYCGHCNMNTDIKEANFFGYDGEFIVAGSDDGAFYIWDKETTNIVKAVHADLQILNCVQPHPTICMLATSGIEPYVKLWSPTGKICHDVKSLEVRCTQNHDFITSDPLEAMIMLLYPEQRDI